MEIKLKPLLAHQRKPLQDQLNLVLQTAACMKKWKKYAERSRDRFNRLTQLVVTEETYVRDLVMLKEKVKQQFVKAKIISLQQSNEIFPNLDGMITLSQQIHLALAEKLKSWNRKATLIGETMSKFSIAFIIYADFFKNLNESQQKLKKLVSTNEKARSIQKSLSLPNRIITIDDLISKPFQRPLKYHLILRDYFSKTEPSHPDYVPLKKAIELYQGINQRNNNSIENKEKNQTLVNLESKFGNIITEARHYIAQYSAVCFQTPVVIYLFSNLAIFVLKKALDRELVRISFNKYSHIETVGDVLLFKNRLYFYGQKICVHLTFSDKLIRDDFYSCLKKLIEQINQNQTTRETIITNRVSRFSQASLKRKFSFTNLDPQLQRPIVAAIIGTEERINKNNQSTNYFVLQFYPQRLNFNTSFTPHHISFLSQDQLIKLQAFIYRLYPAELACISSSTIPRQILNDIQYYKNPQKKIEIKTVLIQLFLNSIFRSSIILKRIDIVIYFLKISDSIWNTLKISNSQVCMCRACLNSPNQYSKHEDYNRQILQREYNRVNQSTTKTKTQYCELRTIQSQQIYSQIRAQLMQTAKSQDKIAWCKSKLGWYNQTLANSHPSSRFLPKIKTKVYYRGFPIMIQFQINCQPSDTVRKIISTIGQRREMNFQDYVLVAQIGNTALILCDDEPIGSIFRQSNQQQGVFDKISHFFSKKEQLTINLYLQKYWVVFNPGDFFSPDKQRRLKVSSQTQSVMSRLSSSQLKMGEEETIELYALFLCKKYFSQFKNFDYQKIASKIRNRQQFYFPSKLQNESAISKLYQKIQKIKQNNQLRTDFDIGVLILQKVSEKPGWSCIMLDAVQQLPNDEIPVKIGCDLRCVRVRQQKKLAFYLEFRLQDDNWAHHTSGNSLIITESQKVFKFIGRQVWKIDQQIQFYKIYLASFGRN